MDYTEDKVANLDLVGTIDRHYPYLVSGRQCDPPSWPRTTECCSNAC